MGNRNGVKIALAVLNGWRSLFSRARRELCVPCNVTNQTSDAFGKSRTAHEACEVGERDVVVADVGFDILRQSSRHWRQQFHVHTDTSEVRYYRNEQMPL